MDKKQRIAELVAVLNEASAAYYGGKEELMSNYEWDALFDELSALERETGIVLPDSPTQTTGSSAGGEKEPHEYPALSLAKTKEISKLQEWAQDMPVWLSWKLDGLTLVVTYDGGRLTKILTRGNGTVGTNISYMLGAVAGIPAEIAEKGHFVVRGEAVISYPDFERINDLIDDGDDKYANPRNLASGTLALDKANLDKVRERNITFNAFTLVHTDRELPSWGDRMDLLDGLGFTTVSRERTDAAGLPDAVRRWTEQVESGAMQLPVDGLVITYDDTDYAASGSVTGHHATRGGLAFKWQDESALTVLDHIEWSCAASTITPVAVFAPVQLEGTTVSRASLCNISELERLGIGENGKTRLEIIKANKIIPKCIRVDAAEGTFTVPETCPVCGAPTALRVSENSGTKTLRCTNDECPAKHLKRFTRFVSKTGMDIDGLSVQTLNAFVNRGFIHSFGDIYRLAAHADEIVLMEGMGEKSCENLLSSVERSRTVHPVNFLYALCIPMIGIDAGKKLIGSLGSDAFFRAALEGGSFETVDGIGPEKSNAVTGWFAKPANRETFEDLLRELRIASVEPQRGGGRCAGLTFVITGAVHTFPNRDAFKSYVEQQGGKVAGSVSGKTDFLVNNDTESGSSKNVKAKQLGVKIISEDEFIASFGN